MKILLVRLDHAGDVVLTVPPAAARLRRAMPACRIDVLTTRTGESLLRDDPHIDRIIAWDAPWSVPPPGLRYVPRTTFVRRVMQFGAMLMRGHVGRYDAIMYLSFSPWERVLTRLLSRRRLGFHGPYTRRAHLWSERLLTAGVRFDEARHIAENCHDLVNLLEVSGGGEPTRLYLDEATRAAAAKRLNEAAGDGANVVLIHPGSPKSFKSWPHEHFVQVAEELAERVGVTCVIVASGHEQADFTEKYGRSSHPRVRYMVTHDLREFGALASCARLVIANDGGPCHITAAAGAPLIAIFGPTNEAIYGPQGKDVRIVRQPHAAAPCNTPWRVTSPCCEGRECLRSLKPTAVIEVALQMIDGQGVVDSQRDSLAAAIANH